MLFFSVFHYLNFVKDNTGANLLREKNYLKQFCRIVSIWKRPRLTIPKPAMKNGNKTCKKIVYHLSCETLFASDTNGLKLIFDVELALI